MLALYLVLAIPGAVVWFSSESLVAVVAMLPAAGVSWWSPTDLRRTLSIALWPLWGRDCGWSTHSEAARPSTRTTRFSRPEKPTD